MHGKVIPLLDSAPFAKGGRRACYVHPHNPGRCLKVALPGKTPGELKQADPWWKRLRNDRHYDENLKDFLLLTALFRRIGPSAAKHLPRVHGLVQTDLGQALETDLVRNADGRISHSAKEYVYRFDIDAACRQALAELRSFLMAHRVPLRDPFPHNLSLRVNEDATVRAVIVDGLGTSGMLYRLQSLPLIAQRRIPRKFNRLMLGMERAAENRRKGIRPKANGLLLSDSIPRRKSEAPDDP